MMQRLKKLFDKVSGNFRCGGAAGGFAFICWLFRLAMEKVFGMIDVGWGFWKIRYFFQGWHPAKGCATISEPTGQVGGVAFLLPVEDDAGDLVATLRSLLHQMDPAWECILCIADVRRLDRLDREFTGDTRIKIVTVPAGQSVGRMLGDILGSIKGGWLVLTRPGDRHDRDLVATILHHEGDILYWDEDFRSGACRLPLLKPDWSPEMWLSVDILRSAAYNVKHLRRVARRQKDEGLLPGCIFTAKRIVHIPEILSHYRKPAWLDARVVALHGVNVNQYLKLQPDTRLRAAIDCKGSIFLEPGAPDDLVSIIIPTKDHHDWLKRCLDSIFSIPERCKYEIVVVDNQSESAETRAYYRELGKRHKNVRVLNFGPGFNFSSACNHGARDAKGRFLLFLNNDVEVISPQWLSRLVAMASLDHVGVVGGHLLYPDGNIQHAGIVVGLEGHAGHVWMGTSGKRYTPFGLASWYRNYSAVTGACLLTRKDVFRHLHGFDENFQLVFGDVDYCLRAGKAGYRTVYDPDVVLVHHEGLSRGRRNPEPDIHLASERLLALMSKGDPYYHPTLSLASRIPTLKFGWEQSSIEKVERITRYGWF